MSKLMQILKKRDFKNCFFPMSPSDSGLSLGGIFSQRIKLNKKFFKIWFKSFLVPHLLKVK